MDEASVRDIPNVRIVHNRGFVAVAAPREWDAVRAANALKVTWTQVTPPFPDQAALHDHIRNAPVRTRNAPLEQGDVAAAVSSAARVHTAEYEWPFHSHSSMAPGVALADVRADGATVYTGTQKPHAVRDGVARLLGLPADKVHAVWMQGPGSYGRNDAGDAAFDAAVLSKELGRPVRVQYSRAEGHGWDVKGPASVHRLRAALDAEGRVTGVEHVVRAFSRTGVSTSESDPRDSLARMLQGDMQAAADTWLFPGDYVALSPYSFGAKRMEWGIVAPLLDRASPLRTGHLRDPSGPETIFAAESFVDELARLTNTDAVEFRLRHLTDPRDLAVLRAAAEKAGWEARPSGPRSASGDVVTGRGVSLSRRDGSHVATVAEVEVDRRTGAIRARRLVCAHDCGRIINPAGLRRTIENGLTYGLSRATKEEVTFSREMVTSLDWQTYPILDITETPDAVEVVLINRPELPSTGAGEPMVRSVGAAVANAIFDASGARIRKAPFTPERVKAALAGA
ncbi:xanthine dehydrogenase family protein molybdopterin-binding subunit [Roseomonas sp. CCTCC AB2023176]|uniref:xanthine dehydrogenase family protein molybdopterin-binding subunit n=1 Tax=Roseomonas sp. CCTCC AB2023176 TaxID=3342640 RepID=UPI0035DDE974